MAIVVNTFLTNTSTPASARKVVAAKRWHLLLTCVLVGLVGLCGLVSCDQKQQPSAAHQLQATSEAALFENIAIAGQKFTLQLALDDEARFRGLSDVKEIPEDGGMLFVFPRPRELTFVMRKCLVPIDLIYVGPGGRIVAMHKMSMVPYDTPESKLEQYSSGWPAQFAIELRQGSIDRLKLKIGQKIELPLASLKARAS